MDNKEKMLAKQLVFNGKIMDLYNDTIILPNGQTATREYVFHTGGSSVLAIDNQNYVYLVEQYRYACAEMSLELPAGKKDKDESFEQCALRELREETGIVANTIKQLGMIYPAPAYSNEPVYIYYTNDFEQGECQLDDCEFLNLIKISFDDALTKVMDGQIKDSKTCIAILKYFILKSQNKIK